MEKIGSHSKTATKNCHKKQITLIYFIAKQKHESPRITLGLHFLSYKVSLPDSFNRVGKAITVLTYMKELSAYDTN